MRVSAGVWPEIRKEFARQSARPDVVRMMVECGMSVSSDEKVFVGRVEVDYSAVARAVGVDRRVVKQTVQQIRRSPSLYTIFSRTKPLGTSLVDLVGLLGYSAVVVEADPRSPGIMAEVAVILARHGMVVRQALADDEDMVQDAKMTLVVEGKLSGEALGELNAIKSVRSIKILK